jgi:hypothetical protein
LNSSSVVAAARAWWHWLRDKFPAYIHQPDKRNTFPQVDLARTLQLLVSAINDGYGPECDGLVWITQELETFGAHTELLSLLYTTHCIECMNVNGPLLLYLERVGQIGSTRVALDPRITPGLLHFVLDTDFAF